MYCTYFAKLYETFASGKVWFRHWWIQFYLFTGFVKVYQSHFGSALSENTSKIIHFGKAFVIGFLTWVHVLLEACRFPATILLLCYHHFDYKLYLFFSWTLGQKYHSDHKMAPMADICDSVEHQNEEK